MGIARGHDEDVVEKIVNDCFDKQSTTVGVLLNVLAEVQKEFRSIPKKALEVLSERSSVAPARLYSICAFYDNLSLLPVGEYLLEVCDGTACHTQGSQRLIHRAEELLGIKTGETTPDGLITLRRVNCVGACSQAPLILTDGVVRGHACLEDIDDVFSELNA